MPAGRPHEPAHLRIVDGSHQRSDYKAKVAAEPQASGNLAEPRDWLTDEQKAAWAYAIEHAPKGMLKKIDRGTLVIWVVAEDIHTRSSIEIVRRKLGDILAQTPKMLVVMDPLIRANAINAGTMPKAASELDFGLAARARATVDPARGEESAEDEFFRS